MTERERGHYEYQCAVCGQWATTSTVYAGSEYDCGEHCGQPMTRARWVANESQIGLPHECAAVLLPAHRERLERVLSDCYAQLDALFDEVLMRRVDEELCALRLAVRERPLADEITERKRT